MDCAQDGLSSPSFLWTPGGSPNPPRVVHPRVKRSIRSGTRPPAEGLRLMSETAAGKENSGRANNFDVLRLVLAVMVIFSHSFPLLWGDNSREPLMRLTGGQITAGELAVAGFFILSGFLITKSWLQSAGLKDYLRRRIL